MPSGTIIDTNATGKEKMLASAFLFGKPLKAGNKIHDAYKGAHKSGNISKRNNNAKLEDGTGGWNLGENGGEIRGTNYSRHALERMLCFASENTTLKLSGVTDELLHEETLA